MTPTDTILLLFSLGVCVYVGACTARVLCNPDMWALVPVLLVVSAAGGVHVLDGCGAGFVVLDWDGLRPNPVDTDGQSYRGDYVLQQPLNVGGYSLGRVVVDTLGGDVTVAASESVAYRQASVSWDASSHTDVVGWDMDAVRVPVTTDAAVNSAGMAASGHLASRWGSVVYATHPAGGWFITDPAMFDPLGIVDGDPPPRLTCSAPGGALPATACGVSGTLNGDAVTVVPVPELRWVLLSAADYAAHVRADLGFRVAITLGTAVFAVGANETVGGSLHRLSPHDAVPDGVVVLGTGGAGAVVEVSREGWVRVGATTDAHRMYQDSPLDAAAVTVLMLFGVSWTVMRGSRLASRAPLAWPLVTGTVVAATAFAVGVAEVAQWRVAPRSVLWVECHTAVAGTGLGVAVLLCVLFAAVAMFCVAAMVAAVDGAAPHPVTVLALRTGVTVAGTCGVVLATVRATGIEYSKRPSMVLVTLPVVFMGIMSRAADAMVDPLPARVVPLRAAAAAVAVYGLSVSFVLALAVFVLQPTLVALTVPYVLKPWQQVVVVALFVAKIVWVAKFNTAVLTGVAPRKVAPH